MTCHRPPSRLFRTILAVLTLLTAGHAATAADSYNAGTLTIPTLMVGNAIYSNVVVTVRNIVSGPTTGPASGAADSYDPITGYLTVPAVVAGTHTYYNVVVTVASLKSVDSVASADSYAAGKLSIAEVLVGGKGYSNVEIQATPADIVSVAGGMPQATADQYLPSSGHLVIPAVQVGSRVYTNVTLAVSPADVVCANCSTGVGGSSFWVPFGEAGAVNGLGVLPSDLSSSVLTQISSTGTEVGMGVAFSLGLSGSTLTTLRPYAQLYAAAPGDGHSHLYRAQLANAGAPPTPVEFGNFSIPASDTVCPGTLGYANATDPSSAFVVFGVYTAAQVQANPGGSICFGQVAPSTSYLARLAGGSTVAIGNVASTGTNNVISLIDAGGALTGIVAFDTSNNLNYYPAAGGEPSFTAPSRIAASVTPNGAPSVVSPGGPAAGSQAFVAVTSSATTPGSQQLWRIQADGTATMIFSTENSPNETPQLYLSTVSDTGNDYFDVVTTTLSGTTSTTSDAYYAVSLPSGEARPLNTYSSQLILLDSDGSRLFLTSLDGTRLLSLSVGSPTAFKTLLSVPATMRIAATLDHPTDQLFVNTIPTFGASGAVSAEVLSATGAVNLKPTTGLQFVSFATPSTATVMIAAQGVTDTTGSLGGATLYTTNTSTFASTPIKLSGAPFVVPAGTTLTALPLSGSLAVAAGLTYSPASGSYFGSLIDLSRAEMIQTSPGPTSILPLF